MSAVNVTLIGTITPIGTGAAAGEGGPCIIQGQLSLSDAHVDIKPPYPQAPGVPTHPIVPPGGYPHPEHPIVLPPTDPPPTNPPDDNGFIKPPQAEGGWAYHEDYGWGYYPPEGGKPSPAPTPPAPAKK